MTPCSERKRDSRAYRLRKYKRLLWKVRKFHKYLYGREDFWEESWRGSKSQMPLALGIHEGLRSRKAEAVDTRAAFKRQFGTDIYEPLPDRRKRDS